MPFKLSQARISMAVIWYNIFLIFYNKTGWMHLITWNFACGLTAFILFQVIEQAKAGETLEELRARTAAHFVDDHVGFQNQPSKKRKVS